MQIKSLRCRKEFLIKNQLKNTESVELKKNEHILLNYVG